MGFVAQRQYKATKMLNPAVKDDCPLPRAHVDKVADWKRPIAEYHTSARVVRLVARAQNSCGRTKAVVQFVHLYECVFNEVGL